MVTNLIGGTRYPKQGKKSYRVQEHYPIKGDTASEKSTYGIRRY